MGLPAAVGVDHGVVNGFELEHAAARMIDPREPAATTCSAAEGSGANADG
jgi:hypothetical protein